MALDILNHINQEDFQYFGLAKDFLFQFLHLLQPEMSKNDKQFKKYRQLFNFLTLNAAISASKSGVMDDGEDCIEVEGSSGKEVN
jgi:hypothetical protein